METQIISNSRYIIDTMTKYNNMLPNMLIIIIIIIIYPIKYYQPKYYYPQHNIYIYVTLHNIKIGKISQRDKSVSYLIINDTYFFYKAGGSLHSKHPQDCQPDSISHCLYKDTDPYWYNQISWQLNYQLSY